MLTKKAATATVGSIGKTSKMPGPSWGISAKTCITGSKLRKVKGSVCEKCYAMKGFYQFPTANQGHAKRLATFHASNTEAWVNAMVALIKNESHFRFLDSGDLQSVEMLNRFIEVAKKLPDCKFWIPTREYDMVSEWVEKNGKVPSNVVIRLSAYMIDGPAPKSVAKRLGVNVSRVSGKGEHNCFASDNNNECGDCRLCWDSSVDCVTYKQH